MSDTPGRPSTSMSAPLTYEDFNVQSQRLSKSISGPFDAKPSTLGLGGSDVPAYFDLRNLNSSKHEESHSAAVAAADHSSLGSAIASIATIGPLNNATSIAPGAYLNASSSSANQSANGLAAVKPLQGTNGAPPFPQNHLEYGAVLSEASTGGTKDLGSFKLRTQLDALSPGSRTTAGASWSLHTATKTSAGNQALSANGAYRPDVSLGNSPAVINKPVLKMKRTGQNFPLSSGTGSLHQRNRSYSPDQRQNSLPAKGSATLKPSEFAKKGGQEPARDERARPLDTKSSEKLVAPSKLEPQQGLHRTGDLGNGSLPDKAKPSTINDGTGETTAAKHDIDTDDIIYETAAQAGAGDATMEDIIDIESSSDDSDSQSEDDDETADMDAGEPSFRQLFRAPDQEDEYNHSEDISEEEQEEDEDEEEDDDATSESSSDDSSNAEEPVALPSASIQHQEAYPSTILEMAEPGRLYTECRRM